ncbi:MAG TPA: hypothetical protein VMB51_14515 [Solirubrobacteraceae bacterium]|nr:hypothetical protein [Solirubrobacteraceae bacterium]
MRPARSQLAAGPARVYGGSRARRFSAAPRAAAALFAAVLGCASVVCAALLAPASARADVFSPISLVSYGAVDGSGFVQQAEYAHDSAISADGRYVAFDGAIGGVTGVWRRDLDTGVIEQVAGGDAAMPSISENGQYVSFTTDEGASLPEITHTQPDPTPRREAVNVYRRDMDVEPAATAGEEATRLAGERAFLAASTASGSEEALRYAAAGETGGSYAAGRSAMSANGSEVVFVTASVSNLVAYPALEAEERAHGETPGPHTPAGQVAVHSFETGATELVSRCSFECGKGAAEGAAEPVVAAEAESKPVGAVTLGSASFPKHGRDGSWPGASISADGSTVAWIGENVAEQAPTLSQEDLEAVYEEPLWRRLPAAANQTRRVTGGSDPEAPGCAASGETQLARGSENAGDPCQGPFVRETAGGEKGGGMIKGSATDFTPRLSADGEEVAFGANARLIVEGYDFNRGEEGNPTDLFVANMRPGLSRDQALTQVTEAGSPASEAESEPVNDFEISPDGQQLAFSTLRTLFTLGWPTLVSTPLPEIGIDELYDADLADGTLTRVTHGYEGEGEQSQQPYTTTSQETGDPYKALAGEPDELGALTPDFSGDGDQLVFTSTAANLVYGDGNSPSEPVDCCVAGDGSDVFSATRVQFPSEPPRQSISPAPQLALGPAWRLGVTARSRPDGSVLLYVRVPGAGSLRAGAQAAVAVESAAGARAAHRARTYKGGSARHSAGASDARKSAAGKGRAKAVATRTLATRDVHAKGAGLTTLTLTLTRGYAALARKRGGQSATVIVTFTATGHTTLRESIHVTFLRTVASKKKKAKKKKGRAHKTAAHGGGRAAPGPGLSIQAGERR